MVVQRFVPSANRYIVPFSDAETRSGPLALLPHAHEQMLEHRKLIRVVASRIEQLFPEFLTQFHAPEGGRADDCLAQLLTRHPRHQVLALVQSFRQPAEPRTFTQIVRAECDDHINAPSGLVLLAGGEQQCDELRGLTGPLAVRILKSEDLFELVHHEQKVFVRLPAMSAGVQETESAGSKRPQAVAPLP